ncbi:MAG: MG2 domain-containing protein, partial [Chitinophagaceae bacterium]
MRKIVYSFFAAVFFLSLISCNRTKVTLEATTARDEVPQLGNLSFHFSKALVGDSQLNRWESIEYISFKPAIEGRFRWEHPDELVFSPSKPLPPATSFKAIFHDEILSHSKYGRLENTDKVAFRTPDLTWETNNIAWVLQDENSNTAVPQIELYFNYPVNPTALKDKLRLELDGKPANYALQTLSTNNKITVRLLNVKAEDRDYDAKIFLDKGLAPEGGTNTTKEVSEIQSVIPSPFVLNINDVLSEHNGTTGTISVKTSQPVLTANLASHLLFSPFVKFSVEQTDDGFMISSDNFDITKSYELKIAKGLRGKLGGVLKDGYNNNLAFGALEPAISFTNSKAIYLSGQGFKNIEVKLTNVPKVKVIISRVYENNLIAAQRYGYNPRETSSIGNENYYYEEEGDATFGDVVYEKEIETSLLPKYGQSRLFTFNLAERLPDFKGIYHISIRSKDDYWIKDSRFISVSDIGLIAREGSDKMVVFANSIKTASPMDGVNILVYGYNNQLLGMGATNMEGIAEVVYTRKEFAGFRPAMVIAKTAGDFNYLPFSSTKVELSRFETGGRRSNSTGLDAFIYAERDIYRPGEKVNFSVIIRDKIWNSPGDMPIKLKFLLPNGKELKTFRKTLNEQGSAEGSIDISPVAITGSYSLEVYTSNDILLSAKAFMIEEFVPDRIKVKVVLDKPSLKAGETTEFQINAVNFFGPPAANRNYEAEIQTKQKSLNVKKYDRFDFSLANQTSFFDKVVREGKTDQNGDARESFKVPETYINIGILQATFYATVFDETGRPVSRSASADIFTQPVFFGVGYEESGYYPLNQTIKFPIIAVDKNEGLVNDAKADVKIIKHEYRTVLSKSGNYFRYDSQKEDKLIAGNTVTISGEKTSYSFVPRIPGEYEIRISLPGATNYVSRSFYSYGSWGGQNSSFEVSTEGNIDIETDKSAYLSGESAKVLFKTPFSGKMLVTMETDKIISHQYVNVDKRSASLDLKLSAAHMPNVYITATLIKPHDVSDIPLTVAHGFQSIKVEEKSRKLAVEITAQKAVRSRTHQKISVKSEPGSYVTLAAVDNGVLQVSDFKTPDPYNFFYAKKALEVNSYDIYPLLFPELKARLSSTGGDADLEMSKRTNPMPNKRIKIVSYWSGIVKANGNGTANFEFDIPVFSGQVRLMAVAYKNQNFGSGETTMQVADPIVLSSALPRFLSPKDTVTVPVTITNTTTKSASAVASIQVTGPLQVIGSNSANVNLAANSENRTVFQVVAAASVNVGKVKISVQGMGEQFVEETEISVRPASTLQKITGSGSVAGNATQHVVINTIDFMPGSADYKLVVSRSPALELGSQLQYLVQYPYGCTEQAVSAAFPQLYYSDLTNMLQVNKTGTSNANYNIQEAIRKIKMRQLYNGSVTLWDNEGTENWWVSTYAAQFLLEAQKAGYEVDKSLIETLLAYINNKLKNKQTVNYYYNRTEQKKIAPKEVAYGLYVLAIAARPNKSVMNYYKANQQVLSLDSRYLLAAAYATAGDKDKFKELLPASFSGEVSVPQTGGSFYSDIRDEAIALNVLIDVDPANAQIPVMARHVADKLKQRSWYSTQESAFSFLALGKLSKAAAKSTVTAEITQNGKVVVKVNGAAVRLSAKELGGAAIDISTKGEGRLYYWWQSEGISVSGAYKEEDSYIKVRRKFFDRFGKAIPGYSFKQNDLVIVQVTIEKSYQGRIDNIVITDLLPAGF